VRDHNRVVTARHKDDVAIVDGHRLVEIPRITIHTLEDKALWRIDTMVVSFLQLTFQGDVVYVVFVGRIA
jgi:hypothetical protein